FSPDANLLATTEGGNGIVRLWDVPSGRERKRLDGRGKDNGGLAFSADGRALAVLRDPGAIQLWDVALGRLSREIDTGDARYYAIRFSPDGRTLAAAGWNQPVRLWEVATGKERGQTERWEGTVYALTFLSNHTLALAAPDHSILLWDLASQRVCGRLEGHRGHVWTLFAFAGGARLLSGSLDATALIWDVSEHVKVKIAPLPPTELDSCWDDLGGADGVRAYR